MSLVEAVDRVFDRASMALPHFVPTRPALVTGAIAGLVVFVPGGIAVFADQQATQRSENALRRFRWVLILGVLVTVSAMVGDFVRDKVYNVSMLTLNRQHFANLHWLQQYSKALR